MQDRIARHRAERGPEWTTIEAPLDLCGALRGVDASGNAILVDCLTLWLSNLMEAGLPPEDEARKLVQQMAGLSAAIILVSNETGLGIVPHNALARDFRDEQGRLNQIMAAACDHVELMVAGLPLAIK
jgi:adenosylcobinamide kinase/adenosylcobinamide-phosphate guanylyltransferase